MGQATAVSEADTFVSWLPLYHDMGLIGAWLGSLYFAVPLVSMAPQVFLARPSRWLRAIHTHRGTISAGPNFAYELCLTKVRDAELEGLDLSSWRLAFNGAEPVSPATIDRFAERFAPYGLRRDAITPVYGLAESSVGLAFPPLGRDVQHGVRATVHPGLAAVASGVECSANRRELQCMTPNFGGGAVSSRHDLAVIEIARTSRPGPVGGQRDGGLPLAPGGSPTATISAPHVHRYASPASGQWHSTSTRTRHAQSSWTHVSKVPGP
jgi:acyl-CoA synthetase (AMP-forming)/AMP-acid ligase II